MFEQLLDLVKGHSQESIVNNPDVPNGTFIRRLTYPTSELSVNTTYVNAAITSQGADVLSTRVWWDK